MTAQKQSVFSRLPKASEGTQEDMNSNVVNKHPYLVFKFPKENSQFSGSEFSRSKKRSTSASSRLQHMIISTQKLSKDISSTKGAL